MNLYNKRGVDIKQYENVDTLPPYIVQRTKRFDSFKIVYTFNPTSSRSIPSQQSQLNLRRFYYFIFARSLL